MKFPIVEVKEIHVKSTQIQTWSRSRDDVTEQNFFALQKLFGDKKESKVVCDVMSAIDLFGLYILFSQYRSCDNTQEAWSFVLFIQKSACRHNHACMPSF